MLTVIASTHQQIYLIHLSQPNHLNQPQNIVSDWITMIIYEYLPPAFGMPGKHSQKSSELAALVTKLARNSKPVAKNSLFIDRAAIFGFSVYLSVCFDFLFYLVAVSRDFLEAAPFILIGFLKEIKSPSVNLYMRISYSMDYIQHLNFRLHI